MQPGRKLSRRLAPFVLRPDLSREESERGEYHVAEDGVVVRQTTLTFTLPLSDLLAPRWISPSSHTISCHSPAPVPCESVATAQYRL